MRGGETCLWGEGINHHNQDEYLWRGAAAAAERLWSPYAATPSHALAADRFAQHLCRLALLGIHAGPIGPGFCPADTLATPPAQRAAAAALAALDGTPSDGSGDVRLSSETLRSVREALRAAAKGV